ncbi:aminotransferase [Endogone sp. FLAS-F59071]|nr:aminotransferase [Endogone sp. FLAS-F59071]|eukprot:RUS22715.1 aminotransferase [Endogone sp. FLAS-F59071]
MFNASLLRNTLAWHPRFLSTAVEAGLKASALRITKADALKPLVPNQDLIFGQTFTDHMLSVEWAAGQGWAAPEIKPYQKLQLSPSAVVFHYSFECFEGMKAYKDKNGKIRLFRPKLNMARFNTSAERIALPVCIFELTNFQKLIQLLEGLTNLHPYSQQFDGAELLELIKTFVKTESRWIPTERGYSLYLRPTMIGTQEFLGVNPSNKALLFVIACPVGPYYKTGFKAVSLYATTDFVRAWPNGTGGNKIGGNYAIAIKPQLLAAKQGYQQNLWLFGEDHQLTEVGTMNCFVLWKNEAGELELVTPPLDGSILPGVTRDSILGLARGWGEFKVSERNVTMPQVKEAVKQGRMVEMFGAGTACIVSPIKKIRYLDEDLDIPLDPKDPTAQAGPWAKRFNDTILDIQIGDLEHEWSVVVD